MAASKIRRLIWERDKGRATIDGLSFDIVSNVRNAANGLRKLHVKSEVVNSIVNGVYADPYMPAPFPKGLWKITEIIADKGRDYFPIKIKTNAHQKVPIWRLDKDGGYDHATEIMVDDSGYCLHWSEFSKTTLGCGRVGKDDASQVITLAGKLLDLKSQGFDLELEVI